MTQGKINIDRPILHECSLLALIVVVGSVLRFWDYANIPFMHDELSALGRLRFDSFTDLVREGVMLGDTHPAGVQVFLYYWTALVGTGETMVKLPFVLSGILSIWLSYSIGKLWFDGTTGLLTATYVSSLQFFVMYSQIARPYISGLLITLLMVYMWSLYFFKKGKPIYLVLFALFGAMASYNHHFSLLFAAMLGVSGLFLVKKNNLIAYSLAGVAIFVLYVPHLHIFFGQLAYGEVGGWLGKPDPIFIFQFLDWIFHFSLWAWGTLVAVVLYIVFTPGDFVVGIKAKQKRWLLFAWFVLPIAIGYMYSVLRSPIIQYSMLIFSTPYLFVLLFSYHKKLSMKQNALLVTALLLANVSTLVFGRDHYNIFYRQPYEETFRAALITNNAHDVFLIDDCIPYYHDYYFNKFGKRVPYFTKRNAGIDLAGFEKIVGKINENTVVAEALTGEELQIVQSCFPYQVGYEDGFTYEIHTFSKNKPVNGEVIKREMIAQTDFETRFGNWKDVRRMIEHDTVTGSSYCSMSRSDVWGPCVSFDLCDIAKGGLGTIDVELGIMMPDTVTKCLVVATILESGESIYWKAMDFESYNPEKGKWKKVFMSLDVQASVKSRRDMEGLVLKIYVWNIQKTELLVDYINIYRKPGNPERYGLFMRGYGR